MDGVVDACDAAGLTFHPVCRDSIVTMAGRALPPPRPLHSLASTLRAIACPCFVTIPGFPLAVRTQTARLATVGVTQERTGLLF